MSDLQAELAAATGVLALALALWFRRPSPELLRDRRLLAALGLFVGAMLVRAFVVRPTFVHADVLGSAIVDSILRFPRETEFKATHGQYGFLAIGALTRALGGGEPAVFRAMQLVGAIDVVLLAALAFRITGSRLAPLVTIAIVGTSPALMRVAASEDVHGFALLLGLLGLLAIDVYAETKRREPLVVAVLALGLLIHTRQTFYPFAPCAFLLALARGGRGLFRRLDFWAAGLVVLALLLPRVVSTGTQESHVLPGLLLVLGSPVLAPTIFAHHVLFDVARYGVLPLLTIAALLWAPFGGALVRAWLVVFLVSFVSTYPCAFPSPGVELAQRLPAIALAYLLTAVFLVQVLERAVPEGARARAALASALILACIPPLFPGWTSVRTETADYREHRIVASLIEHLPRRLTLVVLPIPNRIPPAERYPSIAGQIERTGRRVDVVLSTRLEGAREPLVFLEGLECRSLSFRELTGAHDEVRDYHGLGVRFDRVLFAREPSPVHPPPEPRPACSALLSGSTPLGPRRVLHDPEDDPPFLFYGTREVPVQLHRLAPR